MTKTLDFPDDVRPDFHGFSTEAFDFLSGLKRNNDRTWFAERKDIYDVEVKFQIECLLGEFAPSRGPSALPVRGDPKRGMFRIYRDVRFAKDKQPYKTHAGAVLSRTGGRGDAGIVYIHIDPGACFVSSGFYAPDRDFLTAWRNRMTQDPGGFLDTVAAHTGKRSRYELRHRGALKTLPRGFSEHADSPVAEYLKWKHFLISRPVTDKQAQSRQLVGIVRETAEAALPLLNYGWDVYETMLEDDPRRHMRTPAED